MKYHCRWYFFIAFCCHLIDGVFAMLLSAGSRACIYLAVLGMFWNTCAVAASPQAEAGQELTKAKAALGELRTYVKLDDIASAIEALSSAQTALEATSKDSPDYAQKLSDLQKAIDNSR